MALPRNEVHIVAGFGLRLILFRWSTKALLGQIIEVEVFDDSIIELQPAALTTALLNVRVVMTRVGTSRMDKHADQSVQKFIGFLSTLALLLHLLQLVLLLARHSRLADRFVAIWRAFDSLILIIVLIDEV